MALWNEYYTPTSVAEALGLLQRYNGTAQIVAGGTDLILDMQGGDHPPVEALVDVTQIAGLNEIRAEDGWIVIGAAATHTQIERSALLAEQGMALVESCRVVGGPQVRNVATLGGNIAHALPAADGAIGLLALNAEVQVCTLENHPGGETLTCQWQPLLSIYAGPGRNTLAMNQMLGAFRFAMRQPGEGSAFDRIMRPQGVALPILGVAAKLTLDETRERVRRAIIAVGPAGPVPFRATEAEEVLVNAARYDAVVVEQAVSAAQQQAQLRTSKHRASKEYRLEMVGVLLRRVLDRAVTRARS